ncbi:MAG: dihydroneopterin aldolase [Verrucomicrobia bacterium]|nr:MAG: dihydroneopterin aldolase [Verrucomicrobiota bacterium]
MLGPIARRRAFRENWRRSRPSSLAESRVRCLRDENWRSPSDVLLAKIPTVVIDCIHIEQLELFARVGVPTSERSEPQRLILNITLWPRIAELHDDIANTVNYSAVAERVKDFIRRHDYKLIETLAEETAAHLLTQFSLSKVEVEVRKFVLPDANYVSVTAVREDEAT